MHSIENLVIGHVFQTEHLVKLIQIYIYWNDLMVDFRFCVQILMAGFLHILQNAITPNWLKIYTPDFNQFVANFDNANSARSGTGKGNVSN